MSDRSPIADSPPGRARQCRAALLTPPGRGAIATVAVAGRDALSVVERLFQPRAGRPLGRFPCHRIVFGHWRAPGPDQTASQQPGEELVVCRRGADRLEIHCHGGSAAVEHVLGTLTAAGCEVLSEADWLLGQAPDRLIAEARLELARARTLRSAAVLLDQYRGAFSRSVVMAIQLIAAGRSAAAQKELAAVESWSRFGLHLTAPWQVVLVGQSNVGKSSLLNAILGYQRSLVDHAPGTTRDVLTALTSIAGWPVELADTAGSRLAADPWESDGLARATRQVAAADLVLVVADASTPWSDDDQQWVRASPHAPVIVHNKCDLVQAIPPDRPTGVATSAIRATGLSGLLRVVARRLVPRAPDPGAAVPFLARHQELLVQALHTLQDGDPDRARGALHELLGTIPLLAGNPVHPQEPDPP